MFARQPCRKRAGLAPRGLQLHENRGKALRQVVVNVARQTIALFENRLAPFLESIAFDETIVMQRQRRLACDGFDQHDAPPLVLGLSGAAGAERHPSERARAEQQRRGDEHAATGAAAEREHLLRKARIVELVFDRLRPSRRVAEQMSRHALAGKAGRRRRRRCTPSTPFVGVTRRSFTYAIHRSQCGSLLVDQPHRARVALALLDHHLRKPAEEAFDVGLAHQQVEGELDDLGLHARAALGAAVFERSRESTRRAAPRDRSTRPRAAAGTCRSRSVRGSQWCCRSAPQAAELLWPSHSRLSSSLHPLHLRIRAH